MKEADCISCQIKQLKTVFFVFGISYIIIVQI